jgi:hypothetical protein
MIKLLRSLNNHGYWTIIKDYSLELMNSEDLILGEVELTNEESVTKYILKLVKEDSISNYESLSKIII